MSQKVKCRAAGEVDCGKPKRDAGRGVSQGLGQEGGWVSKPSDFASLPYLPRSYFPASLMTEVHTLLPAIVGGLVIRYGAEWAAFPRNPVDVDLEVAAASCQWRGADGYFIVLRPAERTTDRLVSARVLTHNPVPKKWAAIREERTTSDPLEIGFARNRYLYVPDKAEASALAAFEGSEVRIVAFSDIRTTP